MNQPNQEIFEKITRVFESWPLNISVGEIWRSAGRKLSNWERAVGTSSEKMKGPLEI